MNGKQTNDEDKSAQPNCWKLAELRKLIETRAKQSRIEKDEEEENRFL